MQRNGSIKSFHCSGLLLPLYELMYLQNEHEMAQKSRSYILDLDHVKLSLGFFLLLSCLIESIFPKLSGSTFIFVKNTDQKAAHLKFCLISPVAKTPAWFLEGQSMRCTPGREPHIPYQIPNIP